MADALFDATRALVGVAARSVGEEVDITVVEWRTLVLADSRRRVTVSDVADELEIRTSTATGVCDRLVRKCLVIRRESRIDPPATELELTDTGRDLVASVMDRRRQELAAIAAGVKIENVDDAVAVLRAVVRSVEVGTRATTPPP